MISKRYFFLSLLVASFFISCCFRPGTNRVVLAGMDDMVQEHPDSAYLFLSSLDRSLLRTDEDVAHFSLLYSIALDKMYIEVTSDSLIKRAVDYYKNRNNRYTFLSHYYHGLVFENAKNREEAMTSYILAEAVPESKVEPLYLAKLHFAKERIYNYLFLDRKALEEAEYAASYSLEAGHMNNYARAMMDEAAFHIVLGQSDSSHYAKADSCLNLVRNTWDKIRIDRKADWFFCSMNAFTQLGRLEDLKNLLDEYSYLIDAIPERTEWSTLAAAYKIMGLLPEMQSAIDKGRKYGHDKGREGLIYCDLQAFASAQEGDYRSAYESLEEFVDLYNDMSGDIYSHDTKFLEERYQNQIKQYSARIGLLSASILILIAIIIIVALAWMIHRTRMNSRKIQEELNSLREEYEILKTLQGSTDEIGQKTLGLLNNRVNTLSAFLKKGTVAAGELNRLSGDRRVLLESIGMTYAIYAPKFTKELLDKGLSPAEVGYCCLYLMGYSTKQAGDFICHSAYYRISSKIRSKLQIETNQSTLSKWLKQKYAESVQ